MPPDELPLEELRALAQRTAVSAADLLVTGLGTARRDVGTKSSATDLVTDMDRAAERLIVEQLLGARPDDGVEGEEGHRRRGSSGVTWVIDPIDGTTNYVYGFPGFAVSIAARVGDQAAAGVVVDPLHGDIFSAVRGAGATRNGEPIRTSQATDLPAALVATGFSYEAPRRARQAMVLTQVLPAVRDIRRMGAASVDLCWVACGRVDAYYERGLKPWDHAAGALVAAEAGAAVGDLDGGPPSGDFVLAAAPALFAPLQALLTEAGAQDA
jgi:myo-inositol-1(or 4)-monophosphatase